MVSSDSETDIEVDVLDITPSSKMNIGGKTVPRNILPNNLDNVSLTLKKV